MDSIQQTISQVNDIRGGVQTTKGGTSFGVTDCNLYHKNHQSAETVQMRMKKEKKPPLNQQSNNTTTTVMQNELIASDTDSAKENSHLQSREFIQSHSRKHITTHFMKNRKKQQNQGQHMSCNRVNISTLMHALSNKEGHSSVTNTHQGGSTNPMSADLAYGMVFHNKSVKTSESIQQPLLEVKSKSSKMDGAQTAPHGKLNAKGSPLRPSTSSNLGAPGAEQQQPTIQCMKKGAKDQLKQLIHRNSA